MKVVIGNITYIDLFFSERNNKWHEGQATFVVYMISSGSRRRIQWNLWVYFGTWFDVTVRLHSLGHKNLQGWKVLEGPCLPNSVKYNSKKTIHCYFCILCQQVAHHVLVCLLFDFTCLNFGLPKNIMVHHVLPRKLLKTVGYSFYLHIHICSQMPSPSRLLDIPMMHPIPYLAIYPT